ncbi:MAG: hypothetical protein NC548_33280 [Lachnospiraceae bacterium]|nr:hypothetical protein [Lachnospiraceae bacterium]
MNVFYVKKEGTRKFKGYLIGKMRCEFNSNYDVLDIYLCNFINDHGDEYDNNDTSIYAVLNAKLSYVYNGEVTIKISIINCYVRQECNFGFGFGTLMFMALLDDCIFEYCKKNRIAKCKRIDIFGRLSSLDCKNGNWEYSFPFYMGIADKIISTIPQFHYTRTTISDYNGNPCYNSSNIEQYTSFKNDKKYYKEIISLLSNNNTDGYLNLQFYS